jgi:hypothetical protein
MDLGAQISNLAVALGEEIQRVESSAANADKEQGIVEKKGSPISVRALKSSVSLILSSMIEGWANFLAELAVSTNDGLEGSPDVVHALQQAEIDCLLEQRTALDTRTASLTVTRNVYIPTLDKLAIVPRLLGKMHGLDFVLDKGGHGWQKVQKLKGIRDQLTHPKLDLKVRISNSCPEFSLDTVEAVVEISMLDLYECAEGLDWYISQTLGLLQQLVKKGRPYVITFFSVELFCWMILANLRSPAGISDIIFERHHPAPGNHGTKTVRTSN